MPWRAFPLNIINYFIPKTDKIDWFILLISLKLIKNIENKYNLRIKLSRPCPHTNSAPQRVNGHSNWHTYPS